MKGQPWACRKGAALGRRDHQGGRQLPGLGRDRPGAGDPLARPDQGRRGRAVNAELGLLDGDLAERIAAAADRVADGEFDDQFPIDVFQTGSGTSTNMNANEVIANLAGDGAHPNDHVNMGQSSNDVFPSAVHLAALDEATNELLPALEQLEAALQAKASEFHDIVKSGRTHLMDAVPGDARPGVRRLRGPGPARRAADPQRAAPGGADPARRHRHRHRAEHPQGVRRPRARAADRGDRPRDRGPEDPFEAQGNRDALVELSGALKVVAVSLTKIANDLALMGSGPRAGIGELLPPRAPEGLLDHARQGQPGDPRGRAPGLPPR